MSGKGSGRRPGRGYDIGWARLYGHDPHTRMKDSTKKHPHCTRPEGSVMADICRCPFCQEKDDESICRKQESTDRGIQRGSA